MNTTSSRDTGTSPLSVQLPAKMVDTLHDIVMIKGVDINVLVSEYIQNGIDLDLPEVRRKCFFSHVKEVLERHNVPTEAIAEIDDKFIY